MKINTGMEIIAEHIDGDQYKNAMFISYGNSKEGGLSVNMVPFFITSKDDTCTIQTSQLLAYAVPSDEISKSYSDAILKIRAKRSGIVLPMNEVR